MTDLVDEQRLSAWLDDQGLGVGLPLRIGALGGGASNAMFSVQRGKNDWVLRRPAAVALDRADEGLAREFRILSALHGTAVPHPEPIALCQDHGVLGRTFYLMARVDGVSALPAPAGLDDARGREQITWAMVDALAAIHDVDWQGHGLADLGRPEGFHQRQVSRWTTQLASYDGRDLDGIAEVTAWLEARLPGHFEPTLMHADFHMNNVLIASEAPGRVLAVLDWETATIGDPLLDLAGFCEIWRVFAGEGWPTASLIATRYATVRGLPAVPDLAYYAALYNFRMAVLLEGIYQRSLRDVSREPLDAVGDQALAFLGRARELVTS